MKKVKLLTTLSVIAFLFSANACGNNTTDMKDTTTQYTFDSEQKSNTNRTDTNTTDSEINNDRGSREIKPTASGIDINNLNNCTVSASFTNKDIYLNDDGALVMNLTLYEIEKYEPDDIASLKTGDNIVYDGQNIRVASIDNKDGYSFINSEKSDELILTTDRDGKYYVTSDPEIDPFPEYTEIGKITLPVDQDFIYHDNQDPQNADQTYYAGDLITDSSNVNFECSASNGVVEIKNGKILSITRNYMA